MTHSQQPSLEILEKIMEENKEYEDICFCLSLAMREIESLLQEQTLEELLAEMPENTVLTKCRDGWFAEIEGDYSKYGREDTPILALIDLKEKLTSNTQTNDNQ